MNLNGAYVANRILYDIIFINILDFSQIDHITSYLEAFGNWPLLTGKTEQEGNWMKVLTEIVKIAPDNGSPFLLKLDAVELDKNKVVLQVRKKLLESKTKTYFMPKNEIKNKKL